MSERAFIGLGANLGRPVDQLLEAAEELGRWGALRISSLYRTEPLGDPRQPWYVNAVAALQTDDGPEALLERLHALERVFGRPAERGRWVPRTLDLDLLLYGQQILDSPRLTLPHPSLGQRRFVLEPLAELDPDVRDPRSGRSVRELLQALDDPLRVEKLPPQRPRGPEDPER